MTWTGFSARTVFDVASWHAAQRMAVQPWPIDDRQVKFRVDTNGDLLVWDTDLLWSHQWRNSPQPRYAAARLRLSMETLPWTSDPVLAISPSVLRIANRLSTTRNAWLEPNDPHAPLLGLGLTGRYGQMDVDWHTRLILDVWTRLRGEQPLIPATADLGGPPGRLRPVIPIGIKCAIGRGLGMHTMRELLVHASTVLGMPPITVGKVADHQFHRRPKREGGRDPEVLDPDTIGVTIAASRHEAPASRGPLPVPAYTPPHPEPASASLRSTGSGVSPDPGQRRDAPRRRRQRHVLRGTRAARARRARAAPKAPIADPGPVSPGWHTGRRTMRNRIRQARLGHTPVQGAVRHDRPEPRQDRRQACCEQAPGR
jgi:hypothetical protein